MQPVFKVIKPSQQNKHGAIEQEFKVKPIIWMYTLFVAVLIVPCIRVIYYCTFFGFVFFIEEFNNPHTKKKQATNINSNWLGGLDPVK